MTSAVVQIICSSDFGDDGCQRVINAGIDRISISSVVATENGFGCHDIVGLMRG